MGVFTRLMAPVSTLPRFILSAVITIYIDLTLTIYCFPITGLPLLGVSRCREEADHVLRLQGASGDQALPRPLHQHHEGLPGLPLRDRRALEQIYR